MPVDYKFIVNNDNGRYNTSVTDAFGYACWCTLSYTNPDACKTCPNNKALFNYNTPFRTGADPFFPNNEPDGKDCVEILQELKISILEERIKELEEDNAKLKKYAKAIQSLKDII